MNENTRTSLGKWSIVLALAPLIVISLILGWLMFPAWLGHVSGEGGLCLMLAIGTIIYYGSHTVIITSLGGVGLAITAIYKTFWRQGLIGLILNITILIIAGAYLLKLYHKMATDPDRLPIAAYHGDYETVEKLLAKGFDINYKCGDGTALSNASLRGHEQIVELLLSNNADVNICSPLDKAVRWDSSCNTKVVKMLLEHGANPNCLHSAVRHHKEVVQLLLDYNADVNQKDGNGRTPLHFAVIFGCEDNINLLISNGANVNAENNNEETPLHVLVQSWPQLWWTKEFRTNAINILLDSGANIEAKTKNGKTPLWLAAEALNSLDAVKALLERGANSDAINDVHVRFSAVSASMSKDLLKQWVRANASDINTRNSQGDSLLHAAVKGCNMKLVEALLEMGADVNARNNTGDTALHWAMKTSEPEIVELLIKNRAEVNAKNASGKTPLHILSDPPTIAGELLLNQAKKSISVILLSNGADIGIKDNQGKSSVELQQNWIPQTEQGNEYRNEALKQMRTQRK
jgi:ankyrin repeat protein